MKIIDGRKLSKEILAKIKDEVAMLPFQPVFCDVLVGEDPASMQYVDMKMRKAEAVGIRFHKASFPASITTPELVREIEELNKIENMCGIIVQLPLPESIDKQTVLDAISPELDVDCLGKTASEKFYAGNNEVGYPTALACMAILDSVLADVAGPRQGGANKNFVVLGRGLLVGRPVATLLSFRGVSPTVVSSKTENKETLIKQADVIISGIGKGKHISGGMVKEGVILIDAGTSEENNAPPSGQGRASIVGDVDLESVKDVASYVSPVPGGVGPVTVAMLLRNVLTVAKRRSK